MDKTSKNKQFRHLIQIIKANKVKVGIIGSIIVVILIGIINAKSVDNRTNQPKDPSSPSNNENLNYLPQPQTFPNTKEVYNANLRSSITLLFTEEVLKSSIYVSSKPSMKFKTIVRDNDKSTVILEPSTSWQEGTEYKITVQKGITSSLGLKTKEDVVISFTSLVAENPDYSGGENSQGM